MKAKTVFKVSAALALVLLLVVTAGALAVMNGWVPLGGSRPTDDRTVAGAETIADRLSLPTIESVAGASELRTLQEPAFPRAMMESETEAVRAAAASVNAGEHAAALTHLSAAPETDAGRAVYAVALLAEEREVESQAIAAEIEDEFISAFAAFELAKLGFKPGASPLQMMAAGTAAKAAAERVMALDPDHFGARQYLIFAAQFTPKPFGGDPEQAMKLTMDGLEAGEVRCQLVLASLHFAGKRPEQGTAEAIESLGMGLYEKRTMNQAAQWLIENGRASESEPLLAAIARTDADWPAVYDTLALYFEAIGDPERAAIAREAVAQQAAEETEAESAQPTG